ATSRSFLYPEYLGTVTGTTTATPAVAASATITIQNPQSDTAVGNVTSIQVKKADGTLVGDIGGSFSLTAGASASTWANTIDGKISAVGPGVGLGFTASHVNNVVTVTSLDPGVQYNGYTLTVNSNITSRTPASVTYTFTGTVKHAACTAAGQGCGEVSSAVIDTKQFVPNTVFCNLTNCNNSATGTSSGSRDIAMAQSFNSQLVLPTGWTKSISNNAVTLTEPNTTGSEKNGLAATFATTLTTITGSNSSKLAGGVTTGDVQATTTPFTGGADTVPAGGARANVGTFTRTNLIPGQTYNFYPARDDCVASPGVCTYEEEMTNFANWFAYYRTRMHMAKTAIGRAVALAGLGDNFNVGFMTINYSSSAFRAVSSFTTGAGGQKDLWYQKLYGASGGGSTPLIASLSRAGRYFADINPNSMGHTPINSACQPNYVLLTSDGYWNDTDGGVSSSNSAQKPDGTAIGDADHDGSYNTLADVAYYYYNNDLLPEPAVAPAVAHYPNQVPPSGIDTAPHQHITTFTIGMGVSGSLLFDPNYLTPGSSVDYDAIVAGTKQWPTPVKNTETTVDDMWHAAVNGKGRFFSAKDPVALAAGINEVLAAVVARVGAGAAAATSNLQPVAGDNFAFTAQFQTNEWTGDLKAKTISLIDGTIASRVLWSAQAQLDLRLQTDRNIYTLDASDTDPAAIVVVNGSNRTQNANKLRNFCRKDASVASYPTCTDGGLLTQTEMDNNFDPLGGTTGALSQAAGWPGGDPRRSAATESALIRYLRGEKLNEMTLGGSTSTDLFRRRTHLLGDIVNAQPAYVKSAPFSYSSTTDPFYTAFKNNTNGTAATRKGTVYVASNDGMLHAFETDPDNNPYYQSAGVSTTSDNSDDAFVGTLNTNPITGEGAERFAYVPMMLFPTLKRLAEQNYPTNHRFFADGSPAIGDVCFGHSASAPCVDVGHWHTILVAGLNKGGRGYYALDITDPDNPKGMWEVSGGTGTTCLTSAQANSGSYSQDCNIGYTFGNPIIAKRPVDGKWVVIFTSGYNNLSPGDGKGYLYVVDAQTGLILQRLATGVGCDGVSTTAPCTAGTTDPSGLARIQAWTTNAVVDNTALAIYGGDLEGNVWRFQLDDSPAVPRNSVTRLAIVKDPVNATQPITAKPEVAEVNSRRIVYIGTGEFLGDSDKSNQQVQSIYAIKDDMAGVSVGNTPVVNMTRATPTSITNFKRQVLSADSTSTRTVATPVAVDFASDAGWFIDLPDGGTASDAAERVNVDPIIQLGTLVVPSNVPSTQTCVAGGSGWVNFLDIKTGAVVPGTTGGLASTKISGSLIVGINIVKIGDQVKTIVTTADNQQLTKDTPVTPPTVQGRRVTWRELNVE
ncbi:MAG TPA: PilC/PilY family type IV pilus protein, partial [Burkholderiales bacterium]|nr:PilC/PilY family type IV pilus protein [Burkholderiales bacterium]